MLHSICDTSATLLAGISSLAPRRQPWAARGLAIVLTLGFSANSAAENTDGTFIADKVCPLYQSKNKQTNPDNQKSTVGQSFIVKEMLGTPNPHWFRVTTNEPQASLRWIAAECGHLATPVPPVNELPVPQAASCDLQQSYDSQVLALSWQSAFCELNGQGKPECKALNAKRYRADHFTLHGLWPNKSSCGSSYGFCGEVKQPSKNFCDYPAVPLSETVSTQLQRVMPSFAYGSCLERHEWWKHGQCRDKAADNYYELAIRLTDEVNNAKPLANFISRHIGKTVRKSDFIEAWQQSFGNGSDHKVTLKCDANMLTEIRLSLPAEIPASSHLSLLLSQAEDARPGNCGRNFRIDQP